MFAGLIFILRYKHIIKSKIERVRFPIRACPYSHTDYLFVFTNLHEYCNIHAYFHYAYVVYTHAFRVPTPRLKVSQHDSTTDCIKLIYLYIYKLYIIHDIIVIIKHAHWSNVTAMLKFIKSRTELTMSPRSNNGDPPPCAICAADCRPTDRYRPTGALIMLYTSTSYTCAALYDRGK